MIFLGVAHRLHLSVCNGLGLWVHPRKKTSSSNAMTTSTSDQHSDDSDDDELFDDEQRTPVQSFINDVGSDGEMERLFDLDDDAMDTDTLEETGAMINIDRADEEVEDSYIDVDDNWSQDVLVEFDPSLCAFEQESIGKLMKRCRSFVKLVNKSSIMKAYVNKMKKEFNIKRSLQLDCKSRWNSSHRLIETMLIYKKLINRLHSDKYDIGVNNNQTKKLSSIELDKTDWILIESLEYVLRPFIEATKLVGGSAYPTIGISFFAIVQIHDFLEDTKSTTSINLKFISRLKDLLLHQITKYFVNDDYQWNMMKVNLYFDTHMSTAISLNIDVRLL